MINKERLDMNIVGENIERIINSHVKANDIPKYKIFRNIDGWYDARVDYYLKRCPNAINDEFIQMILDNFDCTEEDILAGALISREE